MILYFFSEETYIDIPKTFQSLRQIISTNFFINEKDIKKINICYNNLDSKLLSINNESDYKSFLKKNINNIYLDAGQNNEIYEEYLLQKEKNKESEDIKRLDILIKKDEEYKKLYETKFQNEENELKKINKLIENLNTTKAGIIKYINKNKKLLQNEHQKIKTELSALKQKLGIK